MTLHDAMAMAAVGIAVLTGAGYSLAGLVWQEILERELLLETHD